MVLEANQLLYERFLLESLGIVIKVVIILLSLFFCVCSIVAWNVRKKYLTFM